MHAGMKINQKSLLFFSHVRIKVCEIALLSRTLTNSGRVLLIPGTGNGERGTGNGERGRGTGV